jgi:hypothetical protein
VIVLWDGRGVANDGQPYENSYAWFMRMHDGRVVDGTAFYDSISFNDLRNRVQTRVALPKLRSLTTTRAPHPMVGTPSWAGMAAPQRLLLFDECKSGERADPAPADASSSSVARARP